MLARIRSARGLHFYIAALVLLASNSVAGVPQRTRHPGVGFSRPAETISGRILLVKPNDRLLVLVRTGPSEPTATQLTWTETRDPAGGGVDKSPMTASDVPGETDYAFKVTSSALITVDGRRSSLDRLISSRGAEATVRFMAKRDGDFAVEVKVRR